LLSVDELQEYYLDCPDDPWHIKNLIDVFIWQIEDHEKSIKFDMYYKYKHFDDDPFETWDEYLVRTANEDIEKLAMSAIGKDSSDIIESQLNVIKRLKSWIKHLEDRIESFVPKTEEQNEMIRLNLLHRDGVRVSKSLSDIGEYFRKKGRKVSARYLHENFRKSDGKEYSYSACTQAI
jgi:hypothetical protein